MQPDKSPGPDGFQALFYQHCWEFIGDEVWEVVEDFRRKRRMLKQLNYTHISLIRKKDMVTTFADVRPIALCNTLYKIISKTMANRLKTFLAKLISQEQTGFVPRREISEGIIIANEVIHSAQTQRSKAMMLKLDIKKAYDRLSWRFLMKILQAYGFTNDWLD